MHLALISAHIFFFVAPFFEIVPKCIKCLCIWQRFFFFAGRFFNVIVVVVVNWYCGNCDWIDYSRLCLQFIKNRNKIKTNEIDFFFFGNRKRNYVEDRESRKFMNNCRTTNKHVFLWFNFGEFKVLRENWQREKKKTNDFFLLFATIFLVCVSIRFCFLFCSFWHLECATNHTPILFGCDTHWHCEICMKW